MNREYPVPAIRPAVADEAPPERVIIGLLAGPPQADATEAIQAAASAVERENDAAPPTLLDSLDRRQNKILQELDRLNNEIERMVATLLAERQHDRQAA